MTSAAFTKISRKPLSEQIKFGTNSLIIFTIVFIAMLSLLYLFHANSTATKGYQLKNLEIKRNQLLTENEVLNMKISRIQALETIENDAQIKTMVKSISPKFIRGDTAVAIK